MNQPTPHSLTARADHGCAMLHVYLTQPELIALCRALDAATEAARANGQPSRATRLEWRAADLRRAA